MAKKKSKKQSKIVLDSDTINEISESIAAVQAHTNQNVQLAMAKICRLCEAKDGPFLNIFGTDSLLIHKIEQLLPVTVKEDDELPHKICFRCSAKVEDLHEFSRRCLQAQKDLSKQLGKSFSTANNKKRDVRSAWEEKLNKSKMSNEEICDQMIKKAMKGIGNIVIPDIVKETTPPPSEKKVLTKLKTNPEKKEMLNEKKENSSELEAKDKEKHLSYDDIKDAVIKKAMESIATIDLATLQAKRLQQLQAVPISVTKKKTEDDANLILAETVNNFNRTELFDKEMKVSIERSPKITKLSNKSTVVDPKVDNSETGSQKGKTRTSKRNSVPEEPLGVETRGITQQCPKKCKSKQNGIQDKIETFITKEKEKPVADEVAEQKETKSRAKFAKNNKETSQDAVDEVNVNKTPEVKAKAKVGKGKNKAKVVEEKSKNVDGINNSKSDDCSTSNPTKNESDVMKNVSCIKLTGVGFIYTCHICKINFLKKDTAATHVCEKITKSVPISHVIEDSPEPETPPPEPEIPYVKKRPGPASKTKALQKTTDVPISTTATTPVSSAITQSTQSPGFAVSGSSFHLTGVEQKRYKLVIGANNSITLVEDCETPKPPMASPADTSQSLPSTQGKKRGRQKLYNEPECIINLDENEPTEILPDIDRSEPYPVGLISAANCNSKVVNQTYSVIPSSNPNKLVISTKKNVTNSIPRGRNDAGPASKKQKTKAERKDHPYALLLEEQTRKKSDSNVENITSDPLLRPSYTKSNDIIIQESQISTSTIASKKWLFQDGVYPCHLCDKLFTREKKLETHIKEHSEKFDKEDDELDAPPQKRGRKKKTVK